MARIKTYVLDTVVSEKDIVIGSDADNLGTTKNFEVGVLRDFIVSGLAPNVGGTLKITELIDVDDNTTPEEFINSLNPAYIVSPYEVVIVTLNSSKHLLKLQDTTIGDGETATDSGDFIALTTSLAGTLNYLPKFTPNGNTIGDSLVYDNGTTVSIGTASPVDCALLELNSNRRGFLQPRVTTTQRDNITLPVEGLTIFNTTTHKPNYYNGTSWIELQENSVSGTLNKVAKFTPNGTTVGDSSITDTGSLVTISSNTNINGTTNVTGTTNLTGPTNIVGVTDITGATEITGATTVIGATDITGVTTIKSPVPSPTIAAFTLLDSASGADPFEIRPSLASKRNTFIGTNAGKNTTASAINDTIVGSLAGALLSTGTNNTFLGYVTGAAITTQVYNTFVGSGAGFNATSSYNTFLGAQSGYSNTSGERNIFIGYNTGNQNEIGSYNTLVGFSACANIGNSGVSADYNTSLGHTAGSGFITGDRNLFLGYDAGGTLNDLTTPVTEVDQSVFIGAKTTGGTIDSQTNQIVIGYEAQGLGSNSVVIGNSAITKTSLKGQVVIGTNSPVNTAKLQIDSTTQGFLPPRMTTTQKNAIAAPAIGLVVFDTTLDQLCVRTSSAWVALT
jgi:hypothetical protein